MRCGYRVLKGEREQRAASGAACGFCRDGALQERPAGGLAVAILVTACTAQRAASSSLRDAYRYCVLHVTATTSRMAAYPFGTG